MKIAHLIDYFQPKIGYQETFLALEQIKKGHEVAVVTSDRFYPFSDFKETYAGLLGKRIQKTGEFVEETIKTYRLLTIEIPGTNLIYLTGLNKILKRLNPDLVICHGVYSYSSFQIAHIKSQLKFKLIYDTHAAAFNTDFNASMFKRAYHFLHSKFAVPIIKKNNDAIFAIGKDEQDFICKDFGLFKSQVPVIPLGVDANRFKPDKKKGLIMKNELGFKDKIVIVYSGKISENKKTHLITEALAKIKSNNLVFLMIGGGNEEYVSHILKFAENNGINIRHLPFVVNKELPKYYQCADFGIWPGDPSISILEALSSGLPLILEKNEGTAYLEQSKAVVRINPNSVDDLIFNIRLYIKDPGLILKYSINASKYVENNLSWNKIAMNITKLLE